jgi:hypothetical protein
MFLSHVTPRNIRAFVPQRTEKPNRTYVPRGIEKHKWLMFLREPRNITELTFLEEPRNIRGLCSSRFPEEHNSSRLMFLRDLHWGTYNFFKKQNYLFCLPPGLVSLQNKHTETTSYRYTMTFHIYNNPTLHIIERVITQVKNHKYAT